MIAARRRWARSSAMSCHSEALRGPADCSDAIQTSLSAEVGFAYSAPDLVGERDDLGELGPLLVGGEQVALFRAGEAALRAKRELVKRKELRRLVDPAL